MAKAFQALGGRGRAALFHPVLEESSANGILKTPNCMASRRRPSECVSTRCVRGEVGEPAAENNRGNFLSNIMERSAGVVASGVVPSGLRA